MDLPNRTTVSCDGCVQRTMDVFADYVRSVDDADIPLLDTYGHAAGVLNRVCGPGFASTDVPSVAVAMRTGVVGVLGAVFAASMLLLGSWV